MRCLQLLWATVALLAPPVGLVRAEPEFALRIEVPESIVVPAGSAFSAEAMVWLETEGLEAGSEGAQGWALSITTEGLSSLPDRSWSITGGDVAGTAAGLAGEDPFGLRVSDADSFVHIELTEGVGNEGLVAGVVLSFQDSITLDPASSPHRILGLSFAGLAPTEEEGPAVYGIAFRDGQVGSGQPINNRIIFRGESALPSLTDVETEIVPAVDCTPEPVALIFQSEPHGQLVPTGDGDPVEQLYSTALDGRLEVPTIPGEIGETDLYIGLVSRLEEEGIQGWSLSVAVDGLNVLGATTGNTVGQDVSDNTPPGVPCSPGCRNTGFENTELIDPALPENAGQQGVVSAVVLSLTLPVQLELVSTSTVLGLTVEAPEPVLEGSVVSGRARFQDDLRGSGQPVRNVVTIRGISRGMCGVDQASLRLDFLPRRVGAFRSGDGNGDARINLADPIFLINYLFRSGPDFPCREAADTNGDQMADLSDAVYLIGYLFQSGSPPVGHLECQTSDLSTAQSCPEGATACDA